MKLDLLGQLFPTERLLAKLEDIHTMARLPFAAAGCGCFPHCAEAVASILRWRAKQNAGCDEKNEDRAGWGIYSARERDRFLPRQDWPHFRTRPRQSLFAD